MKPRTSPSQSGKYQFAFTSDEIIKLDVLAKAYKGNRTTVLKKLILLAQPLDII